MDRLRFTVAALSGAICLLNACNSPPGAPDAGLPNTPPSACLFVSEIHRANGDVETHGPDDVLSRLVEAGDAVIVDAAQAPGCTGDAEDPIDALQLAWSASSPKASAQ